MSVVHAAIRFAQSWTDFVRRPQFRSVLVAVHPADREVAPGTIVVVGTWTKPKWALLRCPCGCGQKISLRLGKGPSPRWKVSVDWRGRASLHPSVRQTSGCMSHFWIRKGSIAWCSD